MFGRTQKNVKEVRATDYLPTLKIDEPVIINGSKRNKSGMLSYQVANLQMIGAREEQQDSFAVINSIDVTKIIENGLFAVICDGMGGMTDGKLVSENAVQGFASAFHNLNLTVKENIPVQLSEACYSINRHICETLGTSGGTTAALILIYDSELYWLTVGDSPIYLRRDGSLIKLNKDHIHLNDLYLRELSRETIDKTSAETAEQKNSLTEYIGKKELGRIDFSRKPLPLSIGDAICLCSDGISSYAGETAINIALDLPPRDACAFLDSSVQSINHPAQDNYTCVIISCV